MDINDDCMLVSEQFPHIGKPLRLLWGHPEVDGFIAKLFRDTRGGTRRGFPVEVRDALSRIQAHHHLIHDTSSDESWREQARNRSEGHWNIDGKFR